MLAKLDVRLVSPTVANAVFIAGPRAQYRTRAQTPLEALIKGGNNKVN